jgi:hypothetical protein
LASNTSENCPTNIGKSGTTTALLFTGIFFTFVSLFTISSMSKPDEAKAESGEAVAQTANNHLLQDDGEPAQPVAAVEKEEKGETKTLDAKEQHVWPVTSATIYFQLLLMLAAIYYAMLLTNWGAPTSDSVTAFYFSPESGSNASYWIQLIASWVALFVYILSLILPVICKNRQFG